MPLLVAYGLASNCFRVIQRAGNLDCPAHCVDT